MGNGILKKIDFFLNFYSKKINTIVYQSADYSKVRRLF